MERYIKNLELIIKAAQDDYKQITYDAKTYQQGVIRNYAWLATVVFGIQMALFNIVHSFYISIAILVVAVLLSTACFVVAIDTMRGRGLTIKPYENFTYKQMAHMAWYQKEMRPAPYTGGKILSDDNLHKALIDNLQNSIEANRKILHIRGVRMRKMNRLIIASIIATTMTALSFVPYSLGYWTEKEVSQLSEEQQTPSEPIKPDQSSSQESADTTTSRQTSSGFIMDEVTKLKK